MKEALSLVNLWRCSSEIYQAKGIKEIKNRFSFVFAGLRHRRELVNHLSVFERQTLAKSIAMNPSLLGFIVWPYINKNNGISERFQLIAAHEAATSGANSWMALKSSHRLPLVSLAQFYDDLTIELEYAPWFIREGQLNFSLMLKDVRLITISFSLDCRGAEKIVYLGAIQGSADTSQETYKNIADACCDLRPRDLIFKIFRLFLCEIQAAKLLCIADDFRAMHHTFFGRLKAQNVAMRYDNLWLDQGGTPTEEGFYELAPTMQERPLSEVPTKKRGRYKRRLEMYANISSQIKSNVLALSQPDLANVTQACCDGDRSDHCRIGGVQ